jgi:hypothetical protein
VPPFGTAAIPNRKQDSSPLQHRPRRRLVQLIRQVGFAQQAAGDHIYRRANCPPDHAASGRSKSDESPFLPWRASILSSDERLDTASNPMPVCARRRRARNFATPGGGVGGGRGGGVDETALRGIIILRNVPHRASGSGGDRSRTNPKTTESPPPRSRCRPRVPRVRKVRHCRQPLGPINSHQFSAGNRQIHRRAKPRWAAQIHFSLPLGPDDQRQVVGGDGKMSVGMGPIAWKDCRLCRFRFMPFLLRRGGSAGPLSNVSGCRTITPRSRP